MVIPRRSARRRVGGIVRRRYPAAMSPARHDPGTIPETKLAHARMSRGVTQDELARAVGISVPTYRRLERGEVRNPKLGQLVNCAIALGVELDTVIEDEWREWMPFDARAAAPPEPEAFWHSHRRRSNEH
jgi:transcriptional regulator with XRE-family HTH domain